MPSSVMVATADHLKLFIDYSLLFVAAIAPCVDAIARRRLHIPAIKGPATGALPVTRIPYLLR